MKTPEHLLLENVAAALIVLADSLEQILLEDHHILTEHAHEITAIRQARGAVKNAVTAWVSS